LMCSLISLLIKQGSSINPRAPVTTSKTRRIGCFQSSVELPRGHVITTTQQNIQAVCLLRG
jgi:hypothetical protein